MSVGIRETRKRQRRAEGSDRGAEAAEAAAGLHAQPAPTHLYRPGPERPDARGREEPLHPTHQGEHLTTPQPHLHYVHRLHLHLLVHVHLHDSTSRRRASEPRSHSLPQSPVRGFGHFFLRLAMLPPAAIDVAETVGEAGGAAM